MWLFWGFFSSLDPIQSILERISFRQRVAALNPNVVDVQTLWVFFFFFCCMARHAHSEPTLTARRRRSLSDHRILSRHFDFQRPRNLIGCAPQLRLATPNTCLRVHKRRAGGQRVAHRVFQDETPGALSAQGDLRENYKYTLLF